MNNTVLSQTNPKWSAKPYPKARVSTVGGCGCGLLACVHVAREQSAKANWTPNNLRSWMVSQGFAVIGKGTLWEGITQTLKHIGHNEVVWVERDEPISKAFKELQKGNRIGVILFNELKAPNGVQWTSGGHYVAFNGFKIAKDGRHMFHTQDSGWRKHSGWYSYEKSMRGCVSQMWIVERITEVKATKYRPSKPYKGKLPTKTVKKGDKNSDVKALQAFLNWAVNAKLKVGGGCRAKTDKYIRVFQKTYGLEVDGIFGAKSLAIAKSIVEEHRSKAEIINETALSLAWPAGTPVSKYRKNGGSPCPAFKRAWKKYFPNKTNIAGCNQFVGLVIRSAGYGDMPVGDWAKTIPWLKKHFDQVPFSYKASQLREGDIWIRRDGKTYHTLIIVKINGELMIAEAQQKETYSHINPNLAKACRHHDQVWLFRAK